MNNQRLHILIETSKDYIPLVKNNLILFNKHLPNVNATIICKEAISDLPDNITYKSIDPIINDNWSSPILKHLLTYDPDDYMLFLLSDLYITKPVDIKTLNSVVEDMKKYNIYKCMLDEVSNSDSKIISKSITNNLNIITKCISSAGMTYNFHPAVYKIQHLIDLLKLGKNTRELIDKSIEIYTANPECLSKSAVPLIYVHNCMLQGLPHIGGILHNCNGIPEIYKLIRSGIISFGNVSEDDIVNYPEDLMEQIHIRNGTTWK